MNSEYSAGDMATISSSDCHTPTPSGPQTPCSPFEAFRGSPMCSFCTFVHWINASVTMATSSCMAAGSS